MWLSVVILGFTVCFVCTRYLSDWNEQKKTKIPSPPNRSIFKIASVRLLGSLYSWTSFWTGFRHSENFLGCVCFLYAFKNLLELSRCLLFVPTVLPRLPWNSRARMTPCLSLLSSWATDLWSRVLLSFTPFEKGGEEFCMIGRNLECVRKEATVLERHGFQFRMGQREKSSPWTRTWVFSITAKLQRGEFLGGRVEKGSGKNSAFSGPVVDRQQRWRVVELSSRVPAWSSAPRKANQWLGTICKMWVVICVGNGPCSVSDLSWT